ncbi:MAG: ribonuclease III [Verrucomicrobiae bacterium]|nr:ribonuclease III [Verrucomicrobiae bacterium]
MGHIFQDETLLTQALTHPSLSSEPSGTNQNNQRLEFLGDAVLQLILSEELFKKFPNVGEGLLTKTRAELVNRDSLAGQCRLLKLGDLLLLSKGEEQNGGRTRPSILADAYEAFIGAVFLDAGYTAAREIVLQQFADRLEIMDSPTALRNPKGELQELLQAISPDHPSYELLTVVGPDHDREFEAAVYYRGEEVGRGRGKSKKAAESQAAENALERYRGGELIAKPPVPVNP